MAILLRDQGWELKFATNGVKAFKKWETGTFDLILMDVQIPNGRCQGHCRPDPVMGIGRVSYIVLLILKVDRGQHSVILTDPGFQDIARILSKWVEGFVPRRPGELGIIMDAAFGNNFHPEMFSYKKMAPLYMGDHFLCCFHTV